MDIKFIHRLPLLLFCIIVSLSPSLHADSTTEFEEVTLDDAVVIEETFIDESVDQANSPSLHSTNNSFTYPNAENIYVNDYARLLDSDSVKQIKDQLIKLKSNHGIEMTVITIHSLRDYRAGPNIEPFATALFNHWGVGDAQKNDGVLILVARNERKMRIEIGSGYGSEWDARMKEMIDDEFIPHFKNDNYQRGIKNGVTKTIKTISGSDYSTFSIKDTASGIWDKLGYWWFVIIVPAGIRIIVELRNFIRRRPRECHRCSHPMTLLDEDADDLHLERGQQLEEYLSSVDYYVRHCAQCEHIEIDRYKSWFNSTGACPECKYITLESESDVITHATTSSTGLKRVDYDCKHCGYHDSEMVTIPRKTKSSSSSGGGSFGGGSSGGGGASGSW